MGEKHWKMMRNSDKKTEDGSKNEGKINMEGGVEEDLNNLKEGEGGLRTDMLNKMERRRNECKWWKN